MSLTAGEGGWRVIIVDGAEDMNLNAANALLKVLEEPPPRAILFLITHAPGRLLPTIRSRPATNSLRFIPRRSTLCWHNAARSVGGRTSDATQAFRW